MSTFLVICSALRAMGQRSWGWLVMEVVYTHVQVQQLPTHSICIETVICSCCRKTFECCAQPLKNIWFWVRIWYCVWEASGTVHGLWQMSNKQQTQGESPSKGNALIQLSMLQLIMCYTQGWQTPTIQVKPMQNRFFSANIRLHKTV